MSANDLGPSESQVACEQALELGGGSRRRFLELVFAVSVGQASSGRGEVKNTAKIATDFFRLFLLSFASTLTALGFRVCGLVVLYVHTKQINRQSTRLYLKWSLFAFGGLNNTFQLTRNFRVFSVFVTFIAQREEVICLPLAWLGKQTIFLEPIQGPFFHIIYNLNV